MQEMEERITERVLRKLHLIVNASGAIKDIDELSAALNRFFNAAHGKGGK